MEMRSKARKVHITSTITSRKRRTSIKPEIVEECKTFCKTHQSKCLILYCSFCEMPVCELCKVSTHARHVTEIKGYSELVKAANIRRKYLYKLADYKETNIIPTIKNLILKISECKGRLQSQVTNSIKRYQNYADRHRDKLTVSQEEWIDDVMFRARTFYQVMEQKIDVLKRALVESNAVIITIRNELKENLNSELLLNFAVLRSGLESLHPPIWPQEEISVTLKLETVPEFGSRLLPADGVHELYERNCTLEMVPEIAQPIVYQRVFDAKLPIPKRVLKDENNKISLSSAREMYVSFGEYIVGYPLDNRRSSKVSSNIKFLFIMNVNDNVIDITCDSNGTLFFLTENAVKEVTKSRKIRRCFRLNDKPSALCIASATGSEREIIVGYHDAGVIVKYSVDGSILHQLTHPDPRMAYRPRHLCVNSVGDMFLSDDISNVTILDANGIWKGAISRDVKTSLACGPLRPTGIACTDQRHVFIVDASAVTQLHIFSEDGRYLQTAVFKHFQDAYVVHVDRSGDVWTAFKDGRIRIYRPQFLVTDKRP